MGVEEARGYTDEPTLAMRAEPEPVSPEYANDLARQARRRRVEERAKDKASRVEDATRQVRSFTERLREVAVLAAKDGRDTAPLFAKLKRAIEEEK